MIQCFVLSSVRDFTPLLILPVCQFLSSLFAVNYECGSQFIMFNSVDVI